MKTWEELKMEELEEEARFDHAHEDCVTCNDEKLGERLPNLGPYTVVRSNLGIEILGKKNCGEEELICSNVVGQTEALLLALAPEMRLRLKDALRALEPGAPDYVKDVVYGGLFQFLKDLEEKL